MSQSHVPGRSWRSIVGLLSIVVVLALATTLFVACGGKNSNKIDPLPLTDGGGNPIFQIIYPDACSKDIKDATVSIASKFREILGTSVDIGTDWVNRDGTADCPEIPTEILVGDTNRPESQELMQELGTGEYMIRVVGQKIVIVGKNDFCLKIAINHFMEQYLNGENAGKIPKTLSYEGACDYMYTFTIPKTSQGLYEFTATATTIQGIYNRSAPHKLYVRDTNVAASSNVLDIMNKDGRYLSIVDTVNLGSNMEKLLELAHDYIKAVVIWDENVPATINVATTVAGAESGIIMTKTQYNTYLHALPDDVNVISLVGKFTGKDTGSAKNDAYRWVIREYLATGKCSTEYICSFEDAYGKNMRYTYPRDLAVQKNAFVFDLSPWKDEAPKDDPNQTPGTDLATYMLILETLQELRGTTTLTEIVGFFPSQKYSDAGNDETWTSKYKPTQVEWEFSYLFTPYQCYWAPTAEYAMNMSFHSCYEVETPLEQNRPTEEIELEDSEDNIYMLLVMGDYDSPGSLYTKMVSNWNNASRGELPLAWSFNPNLIDHYPDIIEYFYSTATDNDYFVSNVGGAGWYNPSRVEDTEEQWEMWLEHHLKYFRMTDMSVSPDMWDFQTFSPMAEKYITQYATTGAGTLISNQLGHGTTGGKTTKPHVAENGSVIDEISNRFDRNDPAVCAAEWKIDIDKRDDSREGHATFMSCRCVWITPEYLLQCIEELRALYPDKEIQIVDPYTYYRLLGESLEND